MANPDPEKLTPSSARVRRARRLATRRFREQAGEFLAEGPQAVREALAEPQTVLEVFATREATEKHPTLPVTGVRWTVVSPRVVDAICQTVHPQGIVARCRARHTDLSELLAGAPRLLAVCVGIRDPGNAGVVIRCADAAGTDGVVFTGHSVDPYNPKAVRSSAGSLFHLPVTIGVSPTDVVARLRAAGLRLLAADGTGEHTLTQAAEDGLLEGPTAWLLGNEAHGLDSVVSGLADHRVAVPIYGHAESLNLATAAVLCLYASATAHRER